MLCNADLDVEKEMEALRILKEKMIDGVIYMSNSIEQNIISLIKELEMPTVLVETTDADGIFPSVSIDNVMAASDAVKYLINKGNKRIAYVGTTTEKVNALSKRYAGYKKGLEEMEINLDKEIVYFGGVKARDGYAGINTILDKGNTKIDAVFCASDEIAMGVINALRDRSISVPGDVDVMGFDDIYSASIFYPKLTTVSQPMYDMGSVSMRMLIKSINNLVVEEKHFVLPYRIVERDSCK